MKKWLKKLSIVLLCIMLVNSSIGDITVLKAETVYESSRIGFVMLESVRVRTGPSTSYAQLSIDGTLQYYSIHQKLEVVGEANDSSGAVWYKVKWNGEEADYTWIYGEYVSFLLQSTDDFSNIEKTYNLPTGYADKIRALHEAYPEWNFEIYNTGLDWDTVIEKESRLGWNLITGENTAYLSTQSGAYNTTTHTFIPLDSDCWYMANSDTIAYYIDPRNWLTVENVFMFYSLSFSEFENTDIIQKVINNTFMQGTDTVSNKTYAEIFYESGKNAGVSAIYLATLARQEQGISGTTCTNGATFTYNGKSYSGLYNFYNIGATSGADSWKKGLIYANGGESGTGTSYDRPWTSPYKAIYGGAQFIGKSYINIGQDTMYFQKFNVTGYNTYSHQYMTNVRAAVSQGRIIYNAINSADALNQAYTFIIPVFENMPSYTALPGSTVLPKTEEEQEKVEDDDKEEEESEETKDEEVVTYTLKEMADDIGLIYTVKNGDKYLSSIAINSQVSSLKYLAPSGVTINIYDSNGNKLNDNEYIITGYKVEIINSDNSSSNGYLVCTGDCNGDGKISALDYVIIRNYILGHNSMNNSEILAADFNDDGKITALDYVYVRQYILNGGY